MKTFGKIRHTGTLETFDCPWGANSKILTTIIIDYKAIINGEFIWQML